MAVVSLLGLLVFLGGGGIFIALQIFLSTRENKKIGLILPILSFVLSFFIVVVVFVMVGASTVTRVTLLAFVLSNIPTLLYIGIYLIASNSGNRNDQATINSQESSKAVNKIKNEEINNSEINKMKIDDL